MRNISMQSCNGMSGITGGGSLVSSQLPVSQPSASLFYDRFVPAGQFMDLEPATLHDPDGLNRRASRIGFASLDVGRQGRKPTVKQIHQTEEDVERYILLR